ncbi:hypothetical protein [Paludibacter sp.]|uniref:hypothetical protein n=1 Tax=Paludibacter sp. TaxID=1898105 RepID=UPI0013554C64|nr:hypothetical protein [Paludibacter sp.]MTK54629.1 hypothetical protein [Paludibacter sp.]
MNKLFILFFGLIAFPVMTSAQTGSFAEPVRYVGGEIADPTVHDGKLRLAVGVENRQVLRANRMHPEMADNFGWTYNHAPNIAYWNKRFFLQYISGAIDEHVAPVHTMLATSPDGRNWSKPQVVFPEYKAPAGVKIPEGYTGYMMHQRMGFYVAPDGRLLVLGFYGHTEHPFGKGGIGRVVREVYKDGSFGPIYFIRYSSYNNWNESNTSYPFYTKSTDKGFVVACKSLLADKLMTLQWLDEDTGKDDNYFPLGAARDSLEATSFYHRKDGKVVFLWKKSMCALSDNEGATVSHPVKAPTLIMPGGKNWGQQTKDGRFAMVYNPIATQEYRYPLIVVTGDDGIIYDNMLVVHGEVPARRFFGRWKDFGPNYTRGIVEGNGNPPGNDMWLTYSVNKEDIWVSRVPLSVRYAVTGDVNDTFDNLQVNGAVPDWNIYAPQWAPVNVVEFPDTKNKSLELADSDPYDYAKAVRIFQTGTNVRLKFKIYPKQNNNGMLCIDVNDRYGNRPVRLWFNENGNLYAQDGNTPKLLQKYVSGKWYEIAIDVNASLKGDYSVVVNGETVLKNAQLAEAVKSVERLSFCTGAYRNKPDRTTPNQQVAPPLAGADEQVQTAIYYIDNVDIVSR